VRLCSAGSMVGPCTAIAWAARALSPAQQAERGTEAPHTRRKPADQRADGLSSMWSSLDR
jgi:hypothetical protein